MYVISEFVVTVESGPGATTTGRVVKRFWNVHGVC